MNDFHLSSVIHSTNYFLEALCYWCMYSSKFWCVFNKIFTCFSLCTLRETVTHNGK